VNSYRSLKLRLKAFIAVLCDLRIAALMPLRIKKSPTAIFASRFEPIKGAALVRRRCGLQGLCF
jgi:hypothetical protein